jgi:hypothetical protein
MKHRNHTITKLRRTLLCGASLAVLLPMGVSAQDLNQLSEAELRAKLVSLTQELESTKQALSASEQQRIAVENKLAQTPESITALEEKYANANDLGPAKITPGDVIPALEGLTIGGAIRASYYLGDYGDTNPNTEYEAGDDGTVTLDVFRINMDYVRGPWSAKFEYRFYENYHFLHTGWIGYDFEDAGSVQVGVNRVPFGPGAYGVSQSWFFDQHYYVGLSDDMDFGVKYSDQVGNLSYDLAFYFADEGTWSGSSNDSSRYSYDVVDESGDGYEERNQLNARAIYATQIGDVNVDLGASAQYGMLESNGSQDDGDHYAVSLHPVFKLNNWTLSTQLTYYKYDVDADQGLGTDELVEMGAYDYVTTVAAEAWIAAASLSYYYEVDQVEWLDYVIPYIEYSSIMKEASGFNDSDLFVVGAAWARGGWYIYTDFAMSNGNDFVGDESGCDRFGANADDDWETRFNINFGYYF